jgi:hypothetical protein
MRNPRAEAAARVNGDYAVRVLEPSPPAVAVGPWFADDPVARGDVEPGTRVVSPVAGGDLRWAELAAADDGLAAWCAERWLAAHPRLGPAPAALVPTRRSLHRLAEAVISPAREAANGKIGLRYTLGGFGTPFFGADVQIRVEGAVLVVQDHEGARRAPLTTLAQAAAAVGAWLPPSGLDFELEPLEVDPEAASFVGQWFGFAASILEELRAEATPAQQPSRVQIWPEHFDMAVELGDPDLGRRAAFGLSPGDDGHPEPYVYVAPWVAPPPGELWQATGFSGAELPYSALLQAPDQREAALDFLRRRVAALEALEPPDPQPASDQ